MAVKDSNFLIFFSCHVIQALICLHISYLGVKKNTSSKVVIFRRELGPYQTTPASVPSAIHQRLCEWNVKYRTVLQWDTALWDSNSQGNVHATRLQNYVCFFAFFWGSFHLGDNFCSKTQLPQNGDNWVSSPKRSEVLKDSSRHSGFNSLWNHEWLGSISSLLEIQP